MKRISVLLLVFCTCFALAAWPQARPQSENKIITFDAPGAGTDPGQGTFGLGLNDLGAIAGFYVEYAPPNEDLKKEIPVNNPELTKRSPI